MGLGAIKILLFLFLNLLLQRILLIPLSSISKEYWSHLDGRGLNEPWFISNCIISLLSAVVVCYLFLKYFDKKKWDYVRFTFDNYAKLFSLGTVIAAVLIIVFTFINSVAGNIELSFNFGPMAKILIYFLVLIFGLIAVVTYEELIFRGYILKTLEHHFNKITAVLVSSLLFSAAHFLRPNASFLGFANIFLAGVFLAIICLHFNNLWIPTGFHFGWNFFLWFFNYPVSGQTYPNPVLKLDYNSYNMVVGSKFGPEESVVLTVLLILIIGYFLFRYRSDMKIKFAAGK